MRCGYCMPEEHYVWLPRESLLSFEELDRVAGCFLRLGAGKVRLTGGEPLPRHRRATLIALLPGHRALACARSARHAEVLEGILAAQAAGFARIKLNSVIIRGFNDDEVVPLLEFARAHDLELRFIEYMDVGGATRWCREDLVSRAELLELIAERFGAVEGLSDPAQPNAPAERFALRDGTVFGIIASVTTPFCANCDRSRVTADGTWFTCLYGTRGIDLREPLRMGCSDAELEQLITDAWQRRRDRGAEERLGIAGRGALYQVEGLRRCH